MRSRKCAWSALIACLLSLGGATLAPADKPAASGLSNPFFAMDTCTKQQYPNSTLTPAGQLDLLKELGYGGIGWTLEDAKQTKAMAEMAKQRGVKMFSLYSGATLQRDGLVFEPGLKENIAALKGHETMIWLHTVSRDYARSSADGDDAAVAGLRQIADLAAAANLRVAIYPHLGDWTERVQDGIRLAKKVDRKNFGVIFNLCHCLKVGDEEKIPALLEEAAPYLFAVTINGADTNASQAGWDRLIQTLDRGSFDLLPVLKKLKELKYQDPIGLQGFGIGGDMRDNLTRSMAAWQRLSARAAR